MTEKTLVAALVAVLGVLLPTQSYAAPIVFGQVDTFQAGTTVMNWQEGGLSPNPPTNVESGGPAGAGDKFLQNISSGGNGPGSRMVMFNLEQWAGNYTLAGVDRITANMVNLGSTTLHMRIALRGGPGATVYGSSAAAVLPPDGIWRLVDFDLTTSALTNIGGAGTLAQVLSNVVELRILSAVGGATFTGDPVVGTLGVDNITSRDIANRVLRVTESVLVNGVPRISFTTLAGRSHRVEGKNALTDPDWIPLPNANNVPGDGSVVQVDDTDAGGLPMRFYRVALLPPP